MVSLGTGSTNGGFSGFIYVSLQEGSCLNLQSCISRWFWKIMENWDPESRIRGVKMKPCGDRESYIQDLLGMSKKTNNGL